MKTCYKCKQTLDVDGFHKNASTKDGLAHYCKQCANAYTKTMRVKHPKPSKPYSPVLGYKKPQGAVRKETNRQRMIAKYGIDFVETQDALTDLRDERFG